MSLVDEIERLGQAVQNGTLTKDDAVQQVLECSDGGLTRVAAADLIANWRTARDQYTGVFDAAREGLRKLGRERGQQ